jgi:hypothetical protein
VLEEKYDNFKESNRRGIKVVVCCVPKHFGIAGSFVKTFYPKMMCGGIWYFRRSMVYV